jgi:predicted N-acyltransferase
MIFLRVARHVAHDEIELGNAQFESHEPGTGDGAGTCKRRRTGRLQGAGMADDYVIGCWPRRWRSMPATGTPCWRCSRTPRPFMRHEYLAALHESGSATPATGWTPRFVTLWRRELHAACPLYLKTHSYGEYVFDWAWANAYEQHGLAYYPKALVRCPSRPCPARGCWRATPARGALLQALLGWCGAQRLSSLHLLFAATTTWRPATQAGLMLRHTCSSTGKNGYSDFDAFLATLSQDKRKKIRQERRKVAEAGVTLPPRAGRDITPADWDFFYRCYERTYLEHGNAPYLTRDFFQRMADTMPEAWLLFTAERNGRPIATSLSFTHCPRGLQANLTQTPEKGGLRPLLGRAGAGGLPALRGLLLPAAAVVHRPRLPALRGRRPGRAQDGARALLPVRTTSAHWLAHPAFADAVERFLEREGPARRCCR